MQRDDKRVKLYVGVIWIGDKPGKRISVWAENAVEARHQVEAKYGKGRGYTIYNEQDANRPRQIPDHSPRLFELAPHREVLRY